MFKLLLLLNKSDFEFHIWLSFTQQSSSQSVRSQFPFFNQGATNMNESVRKRSRLDQIRDFCTGTSAHGLGRVVAAKSWPGRLFWIAIFISASGISIHQISLSFTTFFKYPTKTDFFTAVKEQLRFPAVTVCNINYFKQSEIEKTSFWKDMASISL